MHDGALCFISPSYPIVLLDEWMSLLNEVGVVCDRNVDHSRATQLQVRFLPAAVSSITAKHSSSAPCQHPADVIHVVFLQGLENRQGFLWSHCTNEVSGTDCYEEEAKITMPYHSMRTYNNQRTNTILSSCRVMSARTNAFIFGGSGSVINRALNWFPPTDLRIEIRARSWSRGGCCRIRLR